MTEMGGEPAASSDNPARDLIQAARSGHAYSFYRGDTANFLPMRKTMRQPSALAEQVLAGWMPDAPFIGRETTVVAFGSCFAGYISRYLSSLGFDIATAKDKKAYVSAMGDGIVNVFAVRQQFQWAWENKIPTVELWHGYKAEEFGYDESVRLRTRELFDAADVFIITLGLSEVWYDEPTGEIFWRAVPYEKFDAGRHKFRVASSSETLAALRETLEIIRRHKPEASVVFTISPIPLSATFRPVSCVTANSASKAILRAAIDELYRERSPLDQNLYYFPAYEIVTQCFSSPLAKDFRHPLLHVMDICMKAFERYFCRTALGDADLAAAYELAQELDRAMGTELAAEAEGELGSAAARWLAANAAALVPKEQSAQAAKDIEAKRLAVEEQRAARSARLAQERAARVADVAARHAQRTPPRR